ncbi:MAG: 23S rRNA (adenine(2503)-C(2))-methyltransferase RlmN [Peptococcaceae bacterium]|nr:23S rRNA (adenine(2503)-C(2))-methyltransferase RlmN [Peptococcaceae bacterium]
MEKIDCRSLLEAELSELCLSNGLSKFRGKQIFQWVQQKAIADWEEISNISQADKERISKFLSLRPATLIREQKSKDGTRKFLFELADGERIETVLMGYEKDKSRDRQTICVSTQVGCPVGCLFCATGMEGFKRNLTIGEITGQVLDVLRILKKENSEFRITNIVFMGMGEPLLNYDAVLKAISILNSHDGQNIGLRKMTVSTSGVVPKIIQLAKDSPQVGLAISLHSSRDEVRDKLIPINKKYPLASLMAACRTYTQLTNRRVTFEFALNNANTNRLEAQGLVKLLKGIMAHVNLIPVNPVQRSGVCRPTRGEMLMFKKILEDAKIAVSFREEKGLDIDAACGQLRQRLECEKA